ncbi:MAG: glycosyltransferase family 2 protein, partial [Deltaproteobacteria bacterium]|nr:glycosyltransferase family 2 protein [Deltaproteobacteria bacterium]
EKIYQNLIYAYKIFKKFRFPFEIILIDDGSTDNTKDMVLKAAAEHSEIKLVSNINNIGKGFALKNGFSNATGDIIVFLDSDLENHPFQIGKMFKAMRDNNADIVVGTRRHKDSKVKYTLQRKILSLGYYLMIKFLFNLNITDTQAGIKVFKRVVLENIFPKILCKKYAFDIEILALAAQKKFKIIEVPTTYIFSRGNSLGRIKTKDVFNMGLDTLAIFYRIKILQHYE